MDFIQLHFKLVAAPRRTCWYHQELPEGRVSTLWPAFLLGARRNSGKDEEGFTLGSKRTTHKGPRVTATPNSAGVTTLATDDCCYELSHELSQNGTQETEAMTGIQFVTDNKDR
jgi:hypothetical protein